jgi:hypothetical protein
VSTDVTKTETAAVDYLFEQHIAGNGEPIKVLSIDGGGIYGLTAALWLRKLCEADPDFLSGDDVDLFVGCSSGACNALLLAMYACPREAVLDGVLERFWAEPGTFSNTNPLGAMLSLTGKAAWFSEADFRNQLGQYMGATRIGELKQKVLISTFDWNGRDSYPDLAVDDPSPRSEPTTDLFRRRLEHINRRAQDWRETWTSLMLAAGDPVKTAEAWQKATYAWGQAWQDMLGMGHQPDDAAEDRDAPGGGSEQVRAEPQRHKGRQQRAFDTATDAYRHWKPKFFSNLYPDAQDNRCLVAEVAYGAATPPGFRALRGGIGDGASFAANPSVHGISAVIQHRRSAMFERCAHEHHDALHQRHGEATAKLLGRIRMLSLGDGTRQPYFWHASSNYGFKNWGDTPANPWRGHWYGPASYALQAADEEATEIAWELLGHRYFRLNPGVNDMPTVLAAYYARWPQMRTWLLEHIRASADDRPCRIAITEALSFLQSKHWQGAARVDGQS